MRIILLLLILCCSLYSDTFVGYSKKPMVINGITISVDTKFNFVVEYKKNQCFINGKKITNGYDEAGNGYNINNGILTYTNIFDNKKVYLIHHDSTNLITANETFIMGLRAQKIQDYNSALTHFVDAIKLYPDDKGIQNKVNQLAHYLIKDLCLEEKYHEAYKIINTTQLDTNKSEYNSSLGRINFGLGKYIEATMNFSDAIKKNSKDITAWWGLGSCLYVDGLEIEACSAWKKGARINGLINDCIAELEMHHCFEK